MGRPPKLINTISMDTLIKLKDKLKVEKQKRTQEIKIIELSQDFIKTILDKNFNLINYELKSTDKRVRICLSFCLPISETNNVLKVEIFTNQIKLDFNILKSMFEEGDIPTDRFEQITALINNLPQLPETLKTEMEKYDSMLS